MAKNRHVLISSKEVASRLSEDPRTIQRKAKSGEYPAQKLPGLRGAYVFTEADVDSILRKRAERAA